MNQLKYMLECMLLECDDDSIYAETIDVIDNILNIIDGAVSTDEICCQVAIENMKNIVKNFKGEDYSEDFVQEY